MQTLHAYAWDPIAKFISEVLLWGKGVYMTTMMHLYSYKGLWVNVMSMHVYMGITEITVKV